MERYAWPISFAFVGMCAAITVAQYAPSSPTTYYSIECAKAGGHVVWGNCQPVEKSK